MINKLLVLQIVLTMNYSPLEKIFDRGMNPIQIPKIKRVAQFILYKIAAKDEEQFNALLESIGIVTITATSN